MKNVEGCREHDELSKQILTLKERMPYLIN